MEYSDSLAKAVAFGSGFDSNNRKTGTCGGVHLHES